VLSLHDPIIDGAGHPGALRSRRQAQELEL
jgi:hypothetical protein